MLQSEKRSLFRFLGIYLSSTFLLFLIGTSIFYHFQKHQILDAQNSQLNLKAKEISQSLRELHQTFTPTLNYPTSRGFDSAIYNLKKEYIFGSFQPNSIQWKKEFYQEKDKLFHIYLQKPYYLGTSYIVLSKEFNKEPLNSLLRSSFIFLIVAGIFFTILGLFLGRLFIAPMKESMQTMNKFIEDTTHELNTPISTILTNIELLEALYKCEGREEMRRIEIASKTLSRLYEDLTFLKLNHNYHREIEEINISHLLDERVEFFKTLIEAKKIHLHKSIDEGVILTIDRNDAIRLIDNLLSNAIKHNHKEGKVEILLNKKELLVKNSGIGIKEKEIEMIDKRFQRANKSEGGFGIGLDIIGQVVARYNFVFKITSTYQEQTEVKIQWQK